MIAPAAELVARAQERTGLSDLGLDGWQEGLDRLVAAVPLDIGANAEAVSAIEAIVVGRLVNRLRIERWYEDHAAAAGHPVVGPVVIVGLPRTATTALHYLLAVDPQFRYQRAWEVMDPVPPPDAATEHEDARRLAASARPNVRHISTSDGPTEDAFVLGLHFHNQELGLPLPTFTRWWRTSDLTSTFVYHERVLRMLHAHRPPFLWLLKSPGYSFYLTQLCFHYPNARFLMTHRDPVAAFPSSCSTCIDAQQMAVPAQPVNPVELGDSLLEHLVEGTRRVIADRRELGEDRFCDVGQQEIEVDPLGTAERVYDFLGLDLADDVRAATARWALANRRGVRGHHEYAPEAFGRTAKEIRQAFAEYIERFGTLVGID